MAKSIRSKSKRKSRAEFRRTIGTEFHKKNQEKIQEKLKECSETTAGMKSLDKIANLLETSQEPMETETNNNSTTIGVQADEVAPVADFKGENKAPVKKAKRGRKHSLKTPKKKDEKVKFRPKYFVQF